MLVGSDAEVNEVARALVAHRIFWLMLIAVPIAGLPSCALGAISAMGLVVSDHWWQRILAMLGICIGLGSPVIVLSGLRWIHRIPARKRVAELVKMEREALAKCLTELPQPTYFNATCGRHGGAIAVDPSSKKIAVAFGPMQSGVPTKTRSITLNPGELRNWSAEQSGISTLSLIGANPSSSEILRVHHHNQRQEIQRALGTGLRLTTENLEATEIFLNFDFETAKRWVALLDKLAAGRLEIPKGAVEFPSS